MDTKWMNGKLVFPAALVMSLGLIGCSESADEAEADTAAAVVEDAADNAATDTGAAEDAAAATEEAVDDAAAAVEEATETDDDGG